MFNKKLKKVACLTLATVMAFSGVQAMPMKNVEAAIPVFDPSSKYSTFADAVEAMYNEKFDYIDGDYEIVNYSENYEYSVAKKSRVDYALHGEANKYHDPERSFLSNGEGKKASKVVILKKYTKQPITVVDTDGTKQNYNWDFCVATVTFCDLNGAYPQDVNVVVDVRPSSPVTGKVVLPAYITTNDYGKLKCVELGDGAFLKNTSLTEVAIPSTYQRICAYAFTGCTSLTKTRFVKFNNDTPDGSVSEKEATNSSDLRVLGSGAFAGCTNLTNVTIPESLTEGYMTGTGFAGRWYKPVYSGDKWIGSEVQFSDYRGLVVNSYTDAIFDAVQHTAANKASVSKESKYAAKNSCYFMGDGVYRDCYGLKEVTISGTNPYIPTSTFAGCADIEKINIGNSVQQIYFGISSFSGADGNGASKSHLKRLDLNTPSLSKVYFGAYSFKNCESLEEVNITAEMICEDIMDSYSQGYLYTEVQAADHGGEYAFENSFAEGGKFIYKPRKKDTTCEIPSGMFKNCKGLSELVLESGSDINSGEKLQGALEIFDGAFSGVGLKELVLGDTWQSVAPHTGAFYGLADTNTLKIIGGGNLFLYGEPFSNSYHTACTRNVSPLKSVIFDTDVVEFHEETLKKVSGLNDINKEYSTRASFYGLGSGTSLTFGKNVRYLLSSTENCDNVSEKFNYAVTASNAEWSHSAMGAINKIYFKRYDTSVGESGSYFKYKPIRPIYGADKVSSPYDYNPVETVIYADGQTYSSVARYITEYQNYVRDNNLGSTDYNKLVVKEYSSNLESANMEWVETQSSFNPELVNNGQGLKLYYVDGSYDYVEYSPEEQVSGNTTGKNGYILLGSVDESKLKAGNSFTVSASYRDKVGSINVTVVPQKAVEMTVASAGAVIAGTEPKASDVKISGIKFNDGTTADVAEGDISVKLVNGLRYTAGNNAVEVTYKGLTKQLILQATAEEVVSMGAIQLKDKIYPGDTISKSDINVTAYYNSGKVEKGFIDYTIVNGAVTDSNDTIVLRSNNGVESTVKLSVTGLEPRAISVAYNGKPVQAGGVVAKSNFTVTIVYNNGTTRVLKEDEYDLVYAPILGNTSNSVKVVYKADESICETVYVTGVAEETPIVSDNPGDVVIPSSNPSGNENGNGSGVMPTNVPGGNENGNGSVVTPTNIPGEATKVPSSDAPKSTDKPSSTATVSPSVSPTGAPGQVLDLGKLPGTNVSGSSIEVKPNETTKNVTLGVGEKLTVKMSGTGVTYTSSDANVLQVSDTGLVKAKKVGKAQIVATDSSNNKKTVVITVKKAPRAVKVNFKKKTLKKGKTIKIKVSFAKGYYSYSRKFSSSNKKVATVSSKGVIKAKKKGKCKITVKAFNAKKAVITITVK